MKFDIFLKGKVVDLARVTKDVILKTDFYTWLNDQRITKYTKQGYFPISREEEIEYYEKNIKTKNRLQLGVIHKKTNTLIGMMAIYEINNYDGSCRITALLNINDKNINALNYFKEAQSLLIDHAFKKLNLRLIIGTTNSKNLCKISERLFGFKCEAILKDRDYVDGKYCDRYILHLFKKDWLDETR